MGLKATIQDAAVTIFAALDDLTVSSTYTSKASVQYDPDLKQNSSSGGGSYTVDAIQISYKAEQIDGERIRPKDVMILLKGDVITFIPKPNDSITMGSITYTVVTIETDPAEAVWILQARPV